jgi:hypothetical protein
MRSSCELWRVSIHVKVSSAFLRDRVFTLRLIRSLNQLASVVFPMVIAASPPLTMLKCWTWIL